VDSNPIARSGARRRPHLPFCCGAVYPSPNPFDARVRSVYRLPATPIPPDRCFREVVDQSACPPPEWAAHGSRLGASLRRESAQVGGVIEAGRRFRGPVTRHSRPSRTGTHLAGPPFPPLRNGLAGRQLAEGSIRSGNQQPGGRVRSRRFGNAGLYAMVWHRAPLN
jgi:hypothetical protein